MPTLIPAAVPSEDDALPTPVLDDEPSARMARAAGPANDGTPEKPRARSISGEIRVPVRRAPSIRPLPPEEDSEEADEDDEPLIVIERSEMEVTSRTLPPRRRAVKSDPPELRARAGEVNLKSSDDRAIDADEPRIVIDQDALASTTSRIQVGEIDPDDPTPPLSTIDVLDESDTGAVIHDRLVRRAPQPILLDRRRPSEKLPLVDFDEVTDEGTDEAIDDDDYDTGEVDIVVLEARKKPRPERRTKLGVPPAPVNSRRELARPSAPHDVAEDPTKVDLTAAPPGDDTTSDQLAAPPAPASDADTNPHVVAPPPSPASARSGLIRPAMLVDDEDDEEDDDDDVIPPPRGRHTQEMTAAELDDAVPGRANQDSSEQLLRPRLAYEAVDDGWGPPGTTIPPPLLGAIPGSDDDDEVAGAIPMPNIDSSPLMVGPPTLSLASNPAGRALTRALEDATSRAIEVIRQLEHAQSRDEVVDVMIAHLAETHHRAGFFVTRHPVAKGPGELGLFAIKPRPASLAVATLRLDRPSTLYDIIGTRLPYRGPMHDDASRAFLVAVLGACPAEILLVPVAVRERVVGVLFGEHRLRHTFDDQLALSARAAGLALERILRTKRS
jgi:hypothetical protein